MMERLLSLLAKILGFARQDAPDLARLREVTAAQIPGAVPDEVEISEVRCGNESMFWRARYGTRCYHCHAVGACSEAMVTRVG